MIGLSTFEQILDVIVTTNYKIQSTQQGHRFYWRVTVITHFKCSIVCFRETSFTSTYCSPRSHNLDSFNRNVQLSLTFLLEECWKAVKISIWAIIQKNYHVNFKTAPKSRKSTSTLSICSPWSQDKTLWRDSKQDSDAICCWWTCFCVVGVHVEQRGSEQPIVNQLSNVNPQQSNSCIPLIYTPLRWPSSHCCTPTACAGLVRWGTDQCVNAKGKGSCCLGFLGMRRHKPSSPIRPTVIWPHCNYLRLITWKNRSSDSTKGKSNFIILPQGGVSE